VGLIASRQRRFESGELAPGLHGRDDVEQFASGVAEMRNFFPTRHGAAVSRPGMEYLGRTKKTSTVSPRFIPFTITADLSYVLEIGASYIRFWQDGALVEHAGIPVEVASPWTAAHARELKVTQLASSMVLTHPSYAPRELVLVDTTPTWTLSTVSFDITGYAGWVPMIVKPLYVADSSHPAREWHIYVTEIVQRADGTVYESLAEPCLWTIEFDAFAGATILDRADIVELTTNKWPVYPDMPLEITFDLRILGADETFYGARTILGNRIYAGRGGLIGLIGEVLGLPLSDYDTSAPSAAPAVSGGSVGGDHGRFIWYGEDPDYTHSPPAGRNPFAVPDPTDPYGAPLRTEDPSCCCYFEQRLAYGRTDERPNWIWLSSTNNFSDFDKYVEPLDEDAIERQIASLEYEEIRSLVPRERLFVFTSAGVYTYGTGGGEPLSPVGFASAIHVSPVGASLLQPLSLPNALLYERAMGGGVRDMAFSNERGGYHSGDLTFLADHLFDGHRIVAWAHAIVPWGLIWAVRDDGKLLSLLYERERGIVGWSLHETEGWVEDLCVVPEGDSHAVYLSVRRDGTLGTSGHYNVERFTERKLSDVTDAVCLDAAVSFTDGPYTEIAIPTHLQFETYSYVADGEVYGPIQGLGETTITLGKPAGKVHIGLPYTPRLKLLPLSAARTKEKLVKRATLEVELSRGFYVGEDGETPTQFIERQVSDDYDALALETITTDPVDITSAWNRYGVLFIEQRDPLPLTVLGVTREYEQPGRGD
jgi:hypothetical protein